jgi:sensor histidine kinase YesM
MELEQFRFNNKFQYQLEVDPILLNGDYKIPPLIIQPFLENAIHHGLMNKETDDRCLHVSIELAGSNIQYTIRDNGVGRKVAADIRAMNKPEHQSYGIQISTDRISMHNHEEGSRAVVISDLFTNEKPAGTLIKVLVKADR